MIGQYDRYCEREFSLRSLEQTIRDGRKRPVIPTSTLVREICEMVVLGQKSLLAVDQFGRNPEAKKRHGTDREMVASDSTHQRVLKSIHDADVLSFGHRVVQRLEEKDLLRWKLPSGRWIRLGIVDGSQFGTFQSSVFVMAGCVDAVVDLEKSRGRGYELQTSRRLLRRVIQTHGEEFVDVVACDGLYPTHADFKLCRRKGCDLLVKTQEEGLSVLEDAQGLFFLKTGKRRAGIDFQEGVDSERRLRYEVSWAEGFDWKGLEYPLTVAHVRETFFKPAPGRPETVEFWVMTTATGLTGEDLRELAHRRWRIENQAFKRLNALVHSKRRMSQSQKVCEMLLRLWMISLTLLGAYWFEEGLKCIRQTYQSMKITWGCMSRQMMRELILESS